MSIVQSPILGQMRKSFANVNTYVYRGQNVISAKAFNRRDAKSDAQQAHRASFKLISDAAQMLGGFLEQGFPVRSARLSAHNLFMKLNLPHAIDFSNSEPAIDYSLLQVSKGSLANVTPIAVSFSEGVLGIEANANVLIPGISSTDRIQVLVGDVQGNLYSLQQERGSEVSLNMVINLPNIMVEDIRFVYLYTVLADGKKASNSVFVLPE